MKDLERYNSKALEIHHTGLENYEETPSKLPNIIRLLEITKKIKENKERLVSPETEKDLIEQYLLDTQAKITIFRQLLTERKDPRFGGTLKTINDWNELFQDVISYYYKTDSEIFEQKVSEKIRKLEEKNPNRKNQSYKDRVQKLLGDERFKKFLFQELNQESSKLAEIVTKEFIDTSNSLNTFKIIKSIEPEISREFNDKTLTLEKLDFHDIKTKINLKLTEVLKIKESKNPRNIDKLKEIDIEIKVLLAPILRKIALVYKPLKQLEKNEGTTIHETLLKEQASCGGSSEIIRLTTEYLGLKGRSVNYPGHVNYEIYLPSGDILLADNNGNYGINPQTGEARSEISGKYYKSLRMVNKINELSKAELETAYRRLNDRGEIEYYLPKDGSAFPFLQFGRITSQKAIVPQAVINNLANLFIDDNPEEGLMFINQIYLDNNPFGVNLQTGTQDFSLSENSQNQLFEKMLKIDTRTVFTCQNFRFIENQVKKLGSEERLQFLLKGQKYLSDLLNQDSEFFIYLNLHSNLYLFHTLLLEFGIGNKEEIKTNIELALKIYQAEINKYPIESGNNLNREYEEKIKKFRKEINYLNELMYGLGINT